MLDSYKFTLTLTTTSGNVDSKRSCSGRVVGVGFVFTGVPGTTVLTLTTKGANGPVLTILVTPAGNTNGWSFPQAPTVKTTDGSAISAWYADPQVADYLNLAAASSGAGSVDCYVLLEN